MKTKFRGASARRSKFPSPNPTSSLRFPTLNPNETNVKNNDDKVASASRDKETDNFEEMLGCLGSSGDFMEMDSSQGESCIVCDRRGGNLLVCCATGCPITLHEHCLKSGLKYDDVGNFYCPYCWYKREVLRTQELRMKAMEAKKALSCFIDLNMDSDDKGKENDGSDKRKELHMPHPGEERNYDACKDGMEDDRVESEFMEVENFQENDGDNAKFADSSDQCKTLVENESEPVCCDHSLKKTPGAESPVNTMNKERPSKEDISASNVFEVLKVREEIQVEDSEQVEDGGNERIVDDPLQMDPRTAYSVQEENVADGSLHPVKKVVSDSGNLKEGRTEDEEKIVSEPSGTEISDSDAETILMHQWCVKQESNRKVVQSVDSPKKLSSPLNVTPKNIAKTRNQKVTASKKPAQKMVAAKKYTNLTFSNEKRKRLNWTVEEEEMLKEGVQNFSTEVNRNLPWRKILEFGRHVFDPTRNPADLKDKWRNIMAKESSTNRRWVSMEAKRNKRW